VRRARCPHPQGFRTTSVLLLGGTRLVLETPYLREDRRGAGGAAATHGTHGAGCYPVLEVLGIADRVSPATRSEIALHVVQAASSREAAAMLARRGLTSTCRICTYQHGHRRDQQPSAGYRARSGPQSPVPPMVPWQVSGSASASMVAGAHPPQAPRPQTAKGRHGFSTPWREPRLLVIDILNAQGQPDRLRLPLYDGLLGDAEAVWALLIGYLRLLGAAYADVVEFIADGAAWMWKRVERLRTLPRFLLPHWSRSWTSTTPANISPRPSPRAATCPRHNAGRCISACGMRCGTRQRGLRWCRRRCAR